jgi:hypothetical protein
MAGLDPAIHVDPRVKPGGDGKKERFDLSGDNRHRYEREA